MADAPPAAVAVRVAGDTAASTAGPVRPVPDKYAFMRQTNKQKDSAIAFAETNLIEHTNMP